MINREFAAELDPESALPRGRRSASFNISLGAPLADEPLVESALGILSIGLGATDARALSAALMSPYFAVDAEHLVLSRIDLELRNDNRREAALYDLRQRIERHGRGALAARISAWLDWLRSAGAKKTPGQWAHDFTALLESIGWLDAVRLTSDEYQAFDKWSALVEDFARLDDFLGRISRTEAAGNLRSMASSRMHQSETPDSCIQVVGLLESVGLCFDKIWLMGCTEIALPASPSPNPFIPIELQKRYGLPRSTYDKELAFVRKALDRIAGSAPEVIASYPKRRNGENEALRPSALLVKGAETCRSRIEKDSTIKEAVQRGAMLIETVPDSFELPVSEVERAAICGGTTILKDQSLCPFRAFAFHRLNARPFPVPEYGLSRMEQGSILHEALKAFWEKTVDSDALKKIMEHGAISDYISDIADGALKGMKQASPRLKELEKDRLVKLIHDWAQVELRRGPFKVKAVEVKKELTLCGLSLTTRLDRVDVLEHGKEVIIDYKSGAVSRGAWATSRPREPQLLVYSLAGSFDAISFARLSPGESRFVGLSGDELGMKGVKPLEKLTKKERSSFPGDWDGLMARWKAVIEQLAGGFMSGVAVVDPNPELKGMLSPCEHCGLDALCRKAEVVLGNDEEDGEDEDGD
ncbi:MAG: PD-(D/E)XK nuclease family protein [Deltaproteobacteria bacterium]|nr:PD-(D/E)XK nuclease family protein [Deltaproteobacteria bacterium]